MLMLHTRTVRFVHAFCSDVVVLVSALLSFVLFFSCLALIPVSFSGLLTVFCFHCCRLLVRCFCYWVTLVRGYVSPASSGRLGAQTAGGHLSVPALRYSCLLYD